MSKHKEMKVKLIKDGEYKVLEMLKTSRKRNKK